MSLRDKADEIKAAGERARGNWKPQGAPLRAYQNWVFDRQSRGKPVPERENFCHYWRVVAIWYPLCRIRNKIEDIVESDLFFPIFVGLVTLGIVIGLVTGSILSRTFLNGLIFCLVAFYLLIGAVIGAAIPSECGTFKEDWPWLLGFAPSALPSFGITKGLQSLSRRTRERIGLGLAGTLVAGFVGMLLVEAFFAIGFWLFAIIGLIALIVALGFVLVPKLVDWISYKREKAAAAYEDWLDANPPAFRTSEPREPGRISRFFTAVADFFILAAQVVRVNKWKICPIVEIENTGDNLVDNPAFETADNWS
jgi:hypothetical protein